MLLAPFLWIFCEFDEKILDNLSLVRQQRASSFPAAHGSHLLIFKNCAI
jgi:hypothetical protein